MTLAALLRLSRPHFWLYEAGTFAVGVAAAFVFGGGWDALLLLWFCYFLIPANFLIYGINDVFDYATDRLNPKKQGYEALLAPEYHDTVLWGSLLLTAGFLWILAFEPVAALVPFAIFLLCAIFYSASPIRAKTVPGLDSIFSAGHYVATGWFGYAAASGAGIPWLGIAAGMCWAMAMHAYSAVPDIVADRAARLHTIATALGARMTILLCAGLYIAASVLVVTKLGLIATLTLLVPYLVLLSLSIRVADDTKTLLSLYRVFPWLNAIAGGAIWWILVVASP